MFGSVNNHFRIRISNLKQSMGVLVALLSNFVYIIVIVVVLCGLGGIFVEVLKDISSGLAPLSYEEAYSMIHSLRAYKIIKGTRGQKGVNEDKFAEIIVRLSTLLRFATEIKEMDINPLLATEKQVIAVDARIRIEKK
jgi:acetyltransferase